MDEGKWGGVITPFFAGFYYTPVVMEEGVITPYFTGFYFTLVVNEGRGSLPPTSLVFTIPRRDGGGGHYPILRWLLLYSSRGRRGFITPYFASFYFTMFVMEEGSLRAEHGLCTFTAVLRSTQPSTLPGTVK